MSPFITHNILTPRDSAIGFLLLRCIRGYLIVDAYFMMEVHSEDAITDGRAELMLFGSLMQVCKRLE